MPVRVDKAEDQWKKMFIGGLTYATTDDMLKEFYSQYGEVVDCVVMKDPSTKKSRGFGFVTFAEAESVDKAMGNRPHTIDNKQVEPKRAIPRDASGKSETNISVKRLYVSGVRDEHTEEMFREHFSTFGNVTEVDIIVDKSTGKKRGFSFITFDDYDAVDKCVLQKSHMIDNKRCDVKKALSRDEMKKVEMNRDRQERDMRSRGNMRGMDSYGGAPGGRYDSGGAWDQGPAAAWGGGPSAAWGGNGGGGGQGGWGQGQGGGYGGGGADRYGGGGYGAPAAGGWPGPAGDSWGVTGGGRGGPSWGQGGGGQGGWQGQQQGGGWGGQQGGWGGRR